MVAFSIICHYVIDVIFVIVCDVICHHYLCHYYMMSLFMVSLDKMSYSVWCHCYDAIILLVMSLDVMSLVTSVVM